MSNEGQWKYEVRDGNRLETHRYVQVELSTQSSGILPSGHSEPEWNVPMVYPEGAFDTTYPGYEHPEGYILDSSRDDHGFPFPNDFSTFTWPETQETQPKDANPD